MVGQNFCAIIVEQSYLIFKYSKEQTGGVREIENPETISLGQNFPNPVSEITSIPFSVNERQWLTLKIYDELGREIKTLWNGMTDPGDYSAEFDAAKFSSATYYYKLTSPSRQITQNMVIMK